MTLKVATVNFVVAHALEAAPIIEKFRLQKAKKDTVFPRYQGLAINLVICGMGKINAAAGTAYLAAVTSSDSEEKPVWINVGIAGHQSLALGSATIVHKITDLQSDKAYYPLPISTTLTSTELITVDIPERAYGLDAAYDMEGVAYWLSALKFSPLEFVHLVKVVSDNPSQNIDSLDKEQITGFMTGLCEYLDDLIAELREMASHHHSAQGLPDVLTEFLEVHNFTVTQSRQLHRACQRFKAAEIEDELESYLGNSIADSKDLLAQLHARLDKLVL